MRERSDPRDRLLCRPPRRRLRSHHERQRPADALASCSVRQNSHGLPSRGRRRIAIRRTPGLITSTVN